jgi:hypothetical protein
VHKAQFALAMKEGLMPEDATMAKNDFSQMSHVDRMSALVRELPMPSCVDTADKILKLIDYERAEVLSVRERAAERHNKPALSPQAPSAPKAIEAELQKDRNSSAIETVSDLIGKYRTDESSSYHTIRFNVRESYDRRMDRIQRDCGKMKFADLTTAEIQRLYGVWSKGGTAKAAGYSHMMMFRLLFGFGARALKDTGCMPVYVELRGLKFKASKRVEQRRMTEEEAKLIVGWAHRHGRDSIALAQAFQFECNLSQLDVIGQWVPQREPGVSDVTFDNRKWLRGIRWNQIDENLILRHTLSQTNKSVELNLRNAPLVMAELERMERRPSTSRPIVIDEDTQRPYDTYKFRRLWRTMATRAGVPKGVFNMDSREREAQPTTRRSGRTRLKGED